jgi:hypothetical protein
LTDPVPFRFPASVRRRYERLRRFPERLLAIGDAVCSFNPVYGQGMTVAALEAMMLRRLLSHGSALRPRLYFRRIARMVDVPWDIAVGGDLAFPQVPGRRTTKRRPPPACGRGAAGAAVTPRESNTAVTTSSPTRTRRIDGCLWGRLELVVVPVGFQNSATHADLLHRPLTSTGRTIVDGVSARPSALDPRLRPVSP